jgi:predicted SprT family Zn-dependent metalloprotease
VHSGSGNGGRIDRLIRAWSAMWGLPGLEGAVDVTFSQRLRRTLGRCSPQSGRIVLHAALGGSALKRMPEVLCHEVAHVAAFLLFGRAVRPHGPEWARLVSQAGFAPARRAPALTQTNEVVRARGRSELYEHRCPICHFVRLSRRPVLRWRCADCVEAGLSGEMVVTRRPPPSAVT